MQIDVNLENSCLEKKDFCRTCNSKFQTIRPLIRSIAVSKRFIRDLKDEEKINSIIKDILDCSSLEFNELHKFEENVGENLVFRAKKKRLHIVYSVDEKKRRIVFLRAIKNFNEYKKFLGNKKEIEKTILTARDL